MVEVLPESQGDIVGVRVSGKLTDKEYKGTLIPALDQAIQAHGTMRLLCYMDKDFKGWELGAAWDDLTYWLKHKNDFSKLALVGATKWIETATKWSSHIMGGEIKFFPIEGLPKAWEWIKSRS